MQHAPGIPKILVGNRCHLAYKRRVSLSEAEAYAADNRMAFFEMSPLCDFNILESFTELSRLALYRNGMERLWRANKGETTLGALSSQERLWRANKGETTLGALFSQE